MSAIAADWRRLLRLNVAHAGHSCARETPAEGHGDGQGSRRLQSARARWRLGGKCWGRCEGERVKAS
eukprot:5448550-Prymnesium_polylepis.3